MKCYSQAIKVQDAEIPKTTGLIIAIFIIVLGIL